jgi:AraC-like DNA-binding protein
MVTCPSLLVLTRSELLTRMLAGPMERGIAVSTNCLNRGRMPHRFMDLLVDPEGIERCCLVVLQSWRGDHRVRQVLYLDRPVPSGVYAALEAAHPGRIVPATAVARALRVAKPRTTHRTAWDERDGLMSAHGWDPRECRFLEMARSREFAERGEEVIARELGISARQLERLSYRWLGYSPKVILDLCRVEAAARELASGEASLDTVSARCGYTSARTLHRHFRAYTGLTPIAWRRRDRRRRDGSQTAAPINGSPQGPLSLPSTSPPGTFRARG